MSSSQQLRTNRVLRKLGLALVIGGLVFLTSVLAIAGGWDYIHIPGGAEVPMISPGVLLIGAGLMMAWLNRTVREKDAPEEIDVTPLAAWVREFERHQADRELHRLSELHHGAFLNLESKESHHKPAA